MSDIFSGIVECGSCGLRALKIEVESLRLDLPCGRCGLRMMSEFSCITLPVTQSAIDAASQEEEEK